MSDVMRAIWRVFAEHEGSSVSVRTVKSVLCYHRKSLLKFSLDIKIKTFEKVMVKTKNKQTNKKIVGVLRVEMDA